MLCNWWGVLRKSELNQLQLHLQIPTCTRKISEILLNVHTNNTHGMMSVYMQLLQYWNFSIALVRGLKLAGISFRNVCMFVH